MPRLQNGRLQFSAKDKKVFIKTADDKLIDAETGKPFDGAPPDDLDTVRVNNRLRGVIDAANGALTLMAPDPASVTSRRSRCSSRATRQCLPAVEKALEAEKVARVKKVLNEARAAILLAADDTSAPDRIAAIEVIRARGDQDSLALLQGLPADLPADVRAAANGAIKTVERNLALWNTVQNLWYGLSLGSVLLLAAIGLAITFGVMGVINMAHGEMVMLGAYTTYVVQDAHPHQLSRPVRLFARLRRAAGLSRRRPSSASSSSARSSASSTDGRWKPCSPPGASR